MLGVVWHSPKAMMERYAKEKGKELNVTPESLVAAVKEKKFQIVATETAFFSVMIQQAKTLSNVLLNLDWELLIAGEETGFIICDCPVVVVPPKGSNEVGFVVPGSVKYFLEFVMLPRGPYGHSLRGDRAKRIR